MRKLLALAVVALALSCGVSAYAYFTETARAQRAKPMDKIYQPPIPQLGYLELMIFNEETDIFIKLIETHPTTPWAYIWQVQVIPTQKRSPQARIIR